MRPLGYKPSDSELALRSEGLKRAWQRKGAGWRSSGSFAQREETKRKISAGHLGKKLTTEHKQKLSDAHSGKTLSESHKEHIKQALSGRKHSPDHVSKRAASRKGVTFLTGVMRRLQCREPI